MGLKSWTNCFPFGFGKVRPIDEALERANQLEGEFVTMSGFRKPRDRGGRSQVLDNRTGGSADFILPLPTKSFVMWKSGHNGAYFKQCVQGPVRSYLTILQRGSNFLPS